MYFAKYVVSTNAWTTSKLASGPSNRMFHTTTSNGTHLHLFGGISAATAVGGTTYNDFWIYDVKGNTWINMTNAEGNRPSARYGHSAQIYGDGNLLLIMGGFGSDDKAISTNIDIYAYSMPYNKWTTLYFAVSTLFDSTTNVVTFKLHGWGFSNPTNGEVSYTYRK